MTTKNYYKSEIYKPDYTRFGGNVYFSDFYTDYIGSNLDNKRGSVIASRIISDWNFDNRCRKNILDRDRSPANKCQ